MAIWNLFFSTLLLPLIGIALLARKSGIPRGSWMATLILSGGLVGFSFFAAPWGWFGVPLRWLLALLFALAVVVSFRRRPEEELSDDGTPINRGESPLRMMGKILIGLFFGSVAMGAISARTQPARVLDLGVPIRGGTFLIAHGGSAPAANVYAGHATQGFAVDFVKLNAIGARARGFQPDELTSYAIFGTPVISPCDGVVVAAADGLPDKISSVPDEKNASGNQVVLRCGDAEVHLEHLQRGSVSVKAGMNVPRGTPLGRVGSSGSSSEPHLHIYAIREGKALPMTFDGKWLVRNQTIRR
ncbi:MAG TPA: M23 family metallopeptidase [Thermoanaerobaculia bacterium]|jgi:hypothetical protein